MNDERDDDEEIQQGDTVIEIIDGEPVLYTEPGWISAGLVTMGSAVAESGAQKVLKGELVFPPVPRAPGIYRFTIVGVPRDAVYIGQAKKNLVKRFRYYSYRGKNPITPLNRKNTTTRITQRLLGSLRDGLTVSVDIIDDRALADDAIRNDLERILIRRLGDTGVEILNLAHMLNPRTKRRAGCGGCWEMNGVTLCRCESRACPA